MPQPLESAACDDSDNIAKSIQSIEGKRRVLVRSIKDPIHDYIPVYTLLSRFIDTRQLQRLRDVKQLGTSSFVWPGASHSRFEHSLGVACLSRLLASHLQRNQPDLGITDRDVDCVEVAGLCHDLGHGPWSHVWDGMFMPRAMPGKKWRHEEGSELMLDFMVSEYEIPISERDQRFIKALIAGEPSKCSPDEKKFLFDIVANKRNGLDVDKFDYIQRDSQMIGEPIRIDSNRIVNSARVIDEQICYDIKDANQLYEICATRFKLHKMIYNHKAAKAIEYMIVDALLAAESHLHITECVFDPNKFIHLNDHLLGRIESSSAPELERSRSIVRRIRDRDLYKRVDWKVIEWPFRRLFKENVTGKKIVEEVKRLATRDSPSETLPDLEDDDVIVDFSTMHYGMGEENPLKYVKFYSKRTPTSCRNAEKGDYSTLQPDCFAEVLLQVYTKKPEYWGRVQAGYREILDSLNTIFSSNGGVAIDAITPPITEPPSTPRAPTASLENKGSANARTSATPFSNNSFTTVPPGYMPSSPTRNGRKRSRNRSESPTRKRLRR
ncbi:HD-domain/PDEase-like protein [Macrolepiota fuliginosa MF-IS2]|uniref:HD-domain/PDEase-like protein n=1 Tax=Macrolepiota fuliginosa MF-IS2 TaxID=1400762 RepID=A0A9P5X9X7_9AGAR|nr:HD-domain/PDEase-like protein [Macrolepiota fuliginosa MF-IS2]